jgi:predicted metal-dependent phosphoesterase TrpH
MDSTTPIERLIERCREKKITCVAIADHGTVEGALRMREAAPFPVVIAEEILTPQGEIMAVFIEHTIPKGTIEETISRIRQQNGLVCLPHPFDPLRKLHLTPEQMDELAPEIDIIEAFNARSPLPWSGANAHARAFADRHGIAKCAGSDAHDPREIGGTYVEMAEFEGRDGYLAALKAGRITGIKSNPLIHYRTIWTKIKRFF